jgi:hypothetical protein
MKNLSLIRKTALAVAAIAAIVGPRPSTAAQPQVLLTLSVAQAKRGDAWIDTGAEAFVNATVGARLQILDDQSFIMSGGSMPAIVGRWIELKGNDGQMALGLWAKTDQIDLNGWLIPATAGSGSWVGLYFVQVNAPHTDGTPRPRPVGTLPPASMGMNQLLVPLGSSAPGPGPGPGWKA